MVGKNPIFLGILTVFVGYTLLSCARNGGGSASKQDEEMERPLPCGDCDFSVGLKSGYIGFSGMKFVVSRGGPIELAHNLDPMGEYVGIENNAFFAFPFYSLFYSSESTEAIQERTRDDFELEKREYSNFRAAIGEEICLYPVWINVFNNEIIKWASKGELYYEFNSTTYSGLNEAGMEEYLAITFHCCESYPIDYTDYVEGADWNSCNYESIYVEPIEANGDFRLDQTTGLASFSADFTFPNSMTMAINLSW